MNFKFDININDQDYFDYNIFWTTRSPYGKKQIRSFRIVFAVIPAVFALITLIGNNFSTESIYSAIPFLLAFIVLQILLVPLYRLFLHSQIKSLKKTGKMGYSPTSTLEFYDSSFTETTPSNKTEQQYSSVERISIVEGKKIYIHVNNIMSYILPFTCFESKELYEQFLSFISTKCSNIEFYS